jgi:hypothetical protein
MLRFVVRMSLFYSLTVSLVSLIVVSTARAQVTAPADLAQRPIPGVGHDFINMLSETVNPADGSVNLEFKLPTPKDRGISLPFSLTYNSGALFHVFSYQPDFTTWWSNSAPFSGGWSTSLPLLTLWNSWMNIPQVSPTATCYFRPDTSSTTLRAKGIASIWLPTRPGPMKTKTAQVWARDLPAFSTDITVAIPKSWQRSPRIAETDYTVRQRAARSAILGCPI